MTAVRVYVATTEGPSEVQRIAEEDPEVRSVVCLNGTSEALPISAKYDSFVRKPTGVIERLFGHPVFRMDVAARIGDGRSWQLGFAVAHGLHAAGRLAGRGGPAQSAVWLTGTLDNDLNIGAVDHIPEKLKKSAALFAELRSQNIPVTVFLPQENLKETLGGGSKASGLGLEGIRIVPCRSARLRLPEDRSALERTGEGGKKGQGAAAADPGRASRRRNGGGRRAQPRPADRLVGSEFRRTETADPGRHCDAAGGRTEDTEA